jgi:hypothetical protein
MRTNSVAPWPAARHRAPAGVLRFTLGNRGRDRETHGIAVVPSDGGGLIMWSGGF